MEKELKARRKDEILKYLCDENRFMDIRDIGNVVFKKTLTDREVNDIIQEIITEDSTLIKSGGSSIHTEYKAIQGAFSFIENGGFRNQYNRQKSKEAVQENSKEQIEKELQEIQAEKDRLIIELSRMKLKTYFIPIGISLLSLIFAVFSLFKPSDTLSQEQLDRKIEFLEKELRELNGSFKKEKIGQQ